MKANNAVVTFTSSGLNLNRIEFSVSLRRALGHVEVLVLSLAYFAAVLNSLAFTEDLEDSTLVAPLAVTNLNPAFVFILICKVW